MQRSSCVARMDLCWPRPMCVTAAHGGSETLPAFICDRGGLAGGTWPAVRLASA